MNYTHIHPNLFGFIFLIAGILISVSVFFRSLTFFNIKEETPKLGRSIRSMIFRLLTALSGAAIIALSFLQILGNDSRIVTIVILIIGFLGLIFSYLDEGIEDSVWVREKLRDRQASLRKKNP